MLDLKVKRLKTLKGKTIGLIGREKIAPVVFETRFGIHTFGLKFPIDVLVTESGSLSPQRQVRLGRAFCPFDFAQDKILVSGT